MENLETLISLIMSSIAIGSVIVGVLLAWSKFSSMASASRVILAGYRNPDGSPIFRSVIDCTVLHNESTHVTCKKIDEVKAKISELRGDIKKNDEKSMAMFLQLKEFMGSTVTAINTMKEDKDKREK